MGAQNFPRMYQTEKRNFLGSKSFPRLGTQWRLTVKAHCEATNIHRFPIRYFNPKRRIDRHTREVLMKVLCTRIFTGYKPGIRWIRCPESNIPESLKRRWRWDSWGVSWIIRRFHSTNQRFLKYWKFRMLAALCYADQW